MEGIELILILLVGGCFGREIDGNDKQNLWGTRDGTVEIRIISPKSHECFQEGQEVGACSADITPNWQVSASTY
jgi:hypothetical protein